MFLGPKLFHQPNWLFWTNALRFCSSEWQSWACTTLTWQRSQYGTCRSQWNATPRQGHCQGKRTSSFMFPKKGCKARINHLESGKAQQWNNVCLSIVWNKLRTKLTSISLKNRLVLLNKLLEDGNTLYKRDQLDSAAHRYQYALKRVPDTPKLGNILKSHEWSKKTWQTF
jgi:hypothetical protein